MPSHEPGCKRKPFRARKRAAVKPRETPAIYEPIGLGATCAYSIGESEEAELQIPKTVGKLKKLASLVWSSDFALLFELEQAALEGENHSMTGAQHVLVNKLSKRCCSPPLPPQVDDDDTAQHQHKYMAVRDKRKRRPCGWPPCQEVSPLVCSGCRRVGYCSREHQRLHWRAAHRAECAALASAQDMDTVRTMWLLLL